MKNYRFVFGLLFSSVLSYSAHAGTGMPHTEPAPAEPSLDMSAKGTSGNNGLGSGQLVAVATTMPVIDLRSDKLVSRVSLPTTFNYADSNRDAGQELLAETKMAAQAAVAEDVTEPASELLLLAGLSALAIAVRRQSKS